MSDQRRANFDFLKKLTFTKLSHCIALVRSRNESLQLCETGEYVGLKIVKMKISQWPSVFSLV